MDLTKLLVIVVFIVCYEQSSNANNVNVLNKNHLVDRSRFKRSTYSEIYLAFPPDNSKTGKQDNPPALIRLDHNAPNKFKGKFPTPIERFIQRIQNYFSVYNPPEYLNELQRPGINNPENDGDQEDNSNNTHIILPCNGTSTIVIIPVPLENENISSGQNTYPDKLDTYNAPTTSKPIYHNEVKPSPCPELSTSNQNCFDSTTLKQIKQTEEVTTTPKCPETTTQKSCTEEATTPKPKCPEVTTPKPKCPEASTSKYKYPEPTTTKPICPEVTTSTTAQKQPCPTKQNALPTNPKPISGYGPTEVPPINLVAQPVLGSTVVYYYKNPSTLPPNPNPPAYFLPSTPPSLYEEHRRTQPPILRLKQLLFPRLYAAFHPDN